MTPRIALEKHFLAPVFEENRTLTAGNISPARFGKARDALNDFGERRLAAMDGIGIEKAVLSIAGPGVQAETHTATAVRKANDLLAERMAANPACFGGFAHLAVRRPPAARCRDSGHYHLSIVQHIGTDDELMGGEMLGFVRSMSMD